MKLYNQQLLANIELEPPMHINIDKAISAYMSNILKMFLATSVPIQVKGKQLHWVRYFNKLFKENKNISG